MTLTIAYFETRLPPSDPYAECQTLFGKDTACAADIASERVRGYASSTYDTFDDPLSAPPVDPEIKEGLRRVIHLNEQICKQTGQNCELMKVTTDEFIRDYGENP